MTRIEKKSWRRGAVGAVAGLMASGWVLVHAQPPRGSSAPASSSGDVPAQPSASASTAPAPPEVKAPPLETASIPSEPSPAPEGEEWNGAKDVSVMGPLPKGCKAKLLREWLQIHCDKSGAALTVISGSSEGVTADLRPLLLRSGTPVEGTSTFQMPLRRGDRRILQLSTMTFSDYSGSISPSPMFIVSEQWLDDQSGPWVTVGG